MSDMTAVLVAVMAFAVAAAARLADRDPADGFEQPIVRGLCCSTTDLSRPHRRCRPATRARVCPATVPTARPGQSAALAASRRAGAAWLDTAGGVSAAP